MTNENKTERSGCIGEKNSVELGHSTNERGVSMPVAKEKRDYGAEYARRKELEKSFNIKLKVDKMTAFDAKVSLEAPLEDGTKVTRNYLVRKWIDMYLAGTLE